MLDRPVGVPDGDTPWVATPRRSAKALIIDEDHRVLLFRGRDRTRVDVPPWWFPVGGGLQPGETPALGAVREVQEETGLSIEDPGPVAFTRRFTWEFEGTPYDQEESYFVVRTSSFDPDTAGWTATERATILGYRWWSVDDLRTTDETVYPAELADLLERLADPSGPEEA